MKKKKGLGPEAGSSPLGGGSVIGAIHKGRVGAICQGRVGAICQGRGEQRELGGGASDQIRLPEREDHLHRKN